MTIVDVISCDLVALEVAEILDQLEAGDLELEPDEDES